MTRTLILTRHAKSSWHDAELDDFDRPLNDRGRKAAPLIGDWLATRGYQPDLALVSGARRTVDTWAAVASRLPSRPPMQSEPALYLASAASMLAVLRAAEPDVVMMIAHNPGIAHFAAELARDPVAHPDFRRYPTGATLVVRFKADGWDEIAPGQGEVLDFVVPRDLA